MLTTPSVPVDIPVDIFDNQREEMAREALRLVDMEELSGQHPMALSGGQKQRVAIASAIAANKEILIFDEPTSGLDYVHMRQTADALKALKDLGKTVLVITHDMELIALCSDSVVRMENGHVAESYAVTAENTPRLVAFFLGRQA